MGLALVLVMAGLAHPHSLDANHAVAKSQTFATFLNASQVWNNQPPGAVRFVSVCNQFTPGTSRNQGLRDAVNAWNASTGANFQAFWLYGTGEFFGPCTGNEKIEARNGDCSGTADGCFVPDPNLFDAGLFLVKAVILLDFDSVFTQNGARATLAHELGHALGLDEQYLHNPLFACNPDVVSVMDGLLKDGTGRVTSVCDNVLGPQFIDSAWVQTFFSQSFGSPPNPQMIKSFPLNGTTHRVVFKVPQAATHEYERGFCFSSFWVPQPVTLLNADVVYADAPTAQSATLAFCYRHAAPSPSPGSIGVHVGQATLGGRAVTGVWTELFAAYLPDGTTTQTNVMYNGSASSIASSWVSDTANNQLAQCFVQALGSGAQRECRRTVISFMVPRSWWQPVSPGVYYFLEVP